MRTRHGVRSPFVAPETPASRVTAPTPRKRTKRAVVCEGASRDRHYLVVEMVAHAGTLSIFGRHGRQSRSAPSATVTGTAAVFAVTRTLRVAAIKSVGVGTDRSRRLLRRRRRRCERRPSHEQCDCCCDGRVPPTRTRYVEMRRDRGRRVVSPNIYSRRRRRGCVL